MKIVSSLKKYFTETLMHWHRTENVRALPWKSETDPYKIWLSEIIMQQTRVEQGQPYYERFIHNYPTVNDLAAAPDTEVYRLWQGLGYYNRCKNLLGTARFIANDLNGKFPATYEEVLDLKGVGAYTAAAITSFAYKLPYAVVDGNVQRVLARFFQIDIAVDSTEGKKYFQQLAQELLNKQHPDLYNQAIMDFGAVVCKPLSPLCDQCPLQPKCLAYRRELVSFLPVKAKKVPVKKRFFHFILFKHRDQLFIQQRTGNDIWLHLHQPYLVESHEPLSAAQLQQEIKFLKDTEWSYEGSETQKLSHQVIYSRFFTVEVKQKDVLREETGEWFFLKNLKKIGFPKTIVSFFEKKGYF